MPGPYYYWPGNPVIKLSGVAPASETGMLIDWQAAAFSLPSVLSLYSCRIVP
ncbi:hypothetical protein [Candidatus Spongiihabitans sp.]|uniref:hypothetical protein n=1 Tax=Candidatus Spongiihabitans sp. TaxID=3101308 RepID=UPI003C797F97